jgi:hypothetical protein
MLLNVYKRFQLTTVRDSPQKALQDAQKASISVYELCPYCGGELPKTTSYFNKVSTSGEESGPVGMVEVQYHSKDECIKSLHDKIEKLEKKLALLVEN